MIIGAIGAPDNLQPAEKEWIVTQIRQIIARLNPQLALLSVNTPFGKTFAEVLWSVSIPYRVVRIPLEAGIGNTTPQDPQTAQLLRNAVAFQHITLNPAQYPNQAIHQYILNHSDFLFMLTDQPPPNETHSQPLLAPEAVLLYPARQIIQSITKAEILPQLLKQWDEPNPR